MNTFNKMFSKFRESKRYDFSKLNPRIIHHSSVDDEENYTLISFYDKDNVGVLPSVRYTENGPVCKSMGIIIKDYTDKSWIQAWFNHMPFGHFYAINRGRYFAYLLRIAINNSQDWEYFIIRDNDGNLEDIVLLKKGDNML